jgi:3-hydroxybutyryl-CoA dehydrogenase
VAGKSDIKTIGVIGSGTMGSGITAACALNGYKTVLYDIKQDIVDKAVSGIITGLKKLVEKGKIDEFKVKSTERNIVTSAELKNFNDCDIVIEAAIEDLSIKKGIFRELETIVKPQTILASNTSSFSITSISTAIVNRERVVGLHFFNPANIMKLVEVIKGEFTSSETVETVSELCKNLKKVPVICSDTPAFIVNRVARAFYGESLKILGEENIQSENIDKIMKEEGGFAMGPFELMDLIGIDINLSVTKSVYEAFFYDQKYKPSPIQQKMVDAGLLGRKTKQGFYKY